MTASLKNDVINILDQLPQEQLTEVLDFALFVKSRARGSVPQQAVAESASTLSELAVHGTDMVEDAERLYYGQH
jgi:hypothetical protein